MSLWPSNSAQTASAAGYTKFARRTQLTGFVSYGFWNNDEPLQPFTINSALPQIALPESSAEAHARVFSTNLNLVSRPVNDWHFSARVRGYGYNNRTPAIADHRVRRVRHPSTSRRHAGPRALRPQSHHFRRGRDVDRPVAARRHRRLHAQQRRIRLPHFREQGGERAARDGGHGRARSGSRSARSTVSPTARGRG